MMQLPFFSFKGVRSDAMGVVVSEYPPISHPPERFSSVTVPGRSGTLTMLESDQPVYESYSRAFECYLQPGASVDAVFAWLNGNGDLISGNEPSRRYEARVNSQIDLHKVVRHSSYRAFTLIFEVQPLKFLYPAAAEVTLSASPAQLMNPGNTASLPKITILGNGNGLLSIEGQAVNITSMTSGMILDWKAGVITNLSGNSNQASRVAGGPQHLNPGANVVLWSGGITSIRIHPNWSYV